MIIFLPIFHFRDSLFDRYTTIEQILMTLNRERMIHKNPFVYLFSIAVMALVPLLAVKSFGPVSLGQRAQAK